jgi:hypothetical protein
MMKNIKLQTNFFISLKFQILHNLANLIMKNF